jgi:hypothetical protein
MTLQESYDQMRAWLTRPGAKRAARTAFSCVYYDPTNGNKCAVGCLLQQKTLEEIGTFLGDLGELSEELIGKGINDPILDLIGAHKDEGEDGGIEFDHYRNYDFLSRAQRLHDHEPNWSEGKFDVEKLDNLARNFGLKVPA